LEKWFYEWPKNYFVNYTVYSSCFFLVFKESHFASVNTQTQISCIQHSNPTKVIALEVSLNYEVEALLTFDCKVKYFLGGLVVVVVEVEVVEGLEYLFLTLNLGDEGQLLVLREVDGNLLEGDHHVGGSLLPLHRFPPVAVGLRDAHVPPALSAQFYVPVELGGIIDVLPLLLDYGECIESELGRGDLAAGEWLAVFMQNYVDFFVFSFDDEVDDLFDLGEFRMVDVLCEFEGLTSVLHL
jgi:hypothetical protein